MKELKSKRSTIVMVGSFNPAIFQPWWFGNQNLLRKEECEAAQPIVSSEVTSFQTEWVGIQVLKERFQAYALRDGHDDELRDLVVGVFSVLCHTPVSAVGINWAAVWEMESVEKWHMVGHQLVPKDVWRQVLPNPGMAVVGITSPMKNEGSGRIYVKVEPKPDNSIGAEVNNHYPTGVSKEKCPTAEDAVVVLKNNWADAAAVSSQVLDALMRLP